MRHILLPFAGDQRYRCSCGGDYTTAGDWLTHAETDGTDHL